jgi:glycosyltransferase involved in cell wall biosynthesis
MNKIRVLQFITPSGFYGAERWVLALANNSDYGQVVCDLAVTQEGGAQDLSVARYYPPEAGEVHYLPMSGRLDLRVVKKLVNVIKRRKIDIIHTHGYKSDILGLIAARICGIRCVSTPHGFSSNVDLKLAAFIKVGSFMLRFFDKVAPLSEELMADMKRLNVPETKARFIRNGVDLKDIDAALSQMEPPETERTDGKLTIGFIGQLIPRKGIADLLQVFDQLYQSNPRLQLQLLGDGAQRAELEAMAAQLSSSKAIDFLGFRSDRLELLSQFDMFIMTSSLEGIPRCMMEAMAAGVPMVAYDIPGVDQLIDDEKNGLLAKHGDKAGLVNQCQRLLDDPKLARSLALAARVKVDERYSAARMASEYLLLFQELLGRKVITDAQPGKIA